ncbi:salicylate synthase [Nocardia sp. NPDC058658]|uniref:salicylate synthase n=1 Tax=Nocardia sp. NPDC058658 TaxID=3346580 RepID=UPI00364FA019
MTAHRYDETVSTGTFDPLTVISAAVRTGLFTDYVMYERAGCWYLAGRPVWEVIVSHGVVRAGRDAKEIALRWSGTPWQAVHKALNLAPARDWRAFGWAAFELAIAEATHSDTLAHLMIPGLELQVTTDRIVIRSAVAGVAVALEAALAKAVTPSLSVGQQAVSWTAADPHYLDAVAQAVRRIQNGELRKVILSRAVEVPFEVDMVASYLKGRAANTPARSFLLDLGGWQAAGFSPETVVEVDPTGTVSSQPLAGTRRRTGDADIDEALREELHADPKEVFEHATSVKLAVEELTTVGRAGSTHISEFLAIKERGSVQHLASRVVTELAEPHSSWDALGAVFPAITASGIPKSAAYEVISELEREPRGLYAGAVLMATENGMLDAALVLRAVYRRGGRTWLRAGAGVVAASTPEREHEETSEKLASVAPHLVPAMAPVPV